MPILVRDGGTWRTVTDPQVRDGGQWRQVENAHVRDGGVWKQVYTRTAPPGPTPPPPPPPQPTAFNQTFPVLSTSQIYWNSGNQDNQSSSSGLLIQGTFDGTAASQRRTLIFFNDSAIRDFLAGASISEIWFGTSRQSGTHGAASATVRVWSHSEGSPIGSWTGTGITERGNRSFARGESAEVGLTNATGTGFQNGTIRGLAVSTTSNSLNEYARLNLSGSFIRFIGTK